MYEVDFDLVIEITGQTCMDTVPNFNTILDSVFPGGWVGDVESVSGNIKYHKVEPGVTQHTLDLSKKVPEALQEQLDQENLVEETVQ